MSFADRAFEAALTKAVIENQVTIRPSAKPGPLKRQISPEDPIDFRLKPEGVRIRRAKVDDITHMSIWLGNSSEPGWLGSGTDEIELRKWIEEAYLACILEIQYEQSRKKKQPNWIPVAFANIAPLGPKSAPMAVEIGRLLVHHSFRRRGCGTTFIRHLAQGTEKSLHELNSYEIPVSARVHRDNHTAQRFVRYLAFNEAPNPPKVEEITYIWYGYRLQSKPVDVLKREFGEYLQGLHGPGSTAELSQALLSYLADVERSTINQIESGKRFPSIEVLSRLSRVLTSNAAERAAFLLSAIGDPTGKDLGIYLRAEELKPSPNANLCIITDRIGEKLLRSYYNTTLEAVKNGKNRWYFLPEDILIRDGRWLWNSLVEDLGSLEACGAHVKFFSAPFYLCALRIAVTDLDIKSGTCRDVTVGGEDLRRMPLNEDQKVLFLHDFIPILNDLITSASHSAVLGTFGFRKHEFEEKK